VAVPDKPDEKKDKSSDDKEKNEEFTLGDTPEFEKEIRSLRERLERLLREAGK
jgi:hypothetical protein